MNISKVQRRERKHKKDKYGMKEVRNEDKRQGKERRKEWKKARKQKEEMMNLGLDTR